LLGAAFGLAIDKPMGIGLGTLASAKAKIAVLPADVTPVALLGAAFLCGIGDPLSLLAVDRQAMHVSNSLQTCPIRTTRMPVDQSPYRTT
jgi:Na+/H+ antiporter NhaA